MDQKSIPPPSTNLVILAGDLLAVATKTMLDELAGAGHWPAAARVRQCLEAYEHARIGDEITNAQSDDPRLCTVANWKQPSDCAGAICKRFGRCNHPAGDDSFEPQNTASEPASPTQRSEYHG